MPGLALRALDVVERAGNKLPHPFWLFLGLVGVVVALSAALDGTEVEAPAGATAVRSLVSREGLQWIVLHFVENFAHFEPLGIVLVMLMGVAIAEGSGLIPAAMRSLALAVPGPLVVPVLFGIAACGNIGSDAGIVVVPPLAAAIFKQMGWNPVAGIIVGYVGATAGFTANLLPAGTDVIAASLTNAAGARPQVNVLCNWYFLAASVFLLAGLGTYVTYRFTLPRLGGDGSVPSGVLTRATPVERRSLRVALLAMLLALSLWMLTLVPEDGLLRDTSGTAGEFWRSPFFKGLVPILFTLFATGGIAYGLSAGTLTKAGDVVEWMVDAMRRMAGYLVLVLVISQFIRFFQFTRLDQLVAVEGGELLVALGMGSTPIPFLLAFVAIVAVVNLFMASASAKWALFAPVVIPMFMEVGFHPAFTQLLYRMGDSVTNCASPLYPFFPLLLGWVAEHDPEKAKVGTVLSFLVPYAAALLVGWVGMLLVWYGLGWPVGPDSPIRLAQGALG